MNSALQCLSHIPFLTQYFLHSDYEPDINLDNPLGSRGELVKAFAKVIKFLWFGTNASYSPWEFKNAVSEFAQQFRGYEQHDSQELMSFILDGLHEDLNRVKVKPYVEELKLDGNPTDSDQAAAYWTQHTMRNSSLIVDNMHGQYRSQVTCPTCKKTSLKFDPFLMLSVDLPPPLKKVEVCVMPYDLRQNGMILAFAMDGEATVNMLKEKMKEQYGPVDDALFADVDDTRVKKVLDDYSQVPESDYKRMCFAYELPKVPFDSYTKVVLSIQKEERSYGYIRYTSCTSPRVLCILSGSTLKETHFAIFEFMYPMLNLKGKQEKNSWEEESEDMEVDDDAEMTEEINLKEVYTRLYEEVNQPYRYSNTSDKIYSVKTYNYNSQWNNKKSCYDPCPYCHQSHYTNCKLPFDDTLLTDFLCDQDVDRILQLELACPPKLINSAFEKQPEQHPSVERVEKQLDNRHFDSISLLDCLEFTCKEKPLSADNMWFCPVCKEHVMGSKKMTIYKLPRVLLIHLKRFKQGEYSTLKNEKKVEFPIEGLDMAPFLQSEQRQCTMYDLIAVNEHSGSLGFGHYTAHAKDEAGWASYNDSYTSSTFDPLSTLVTSNAYVLFYESKEV